METSAEGGIQVGEKIQLKIIEAEYRSVENLSPEERYLVFENIKPHFVKSNRINSFDALYEQTEELIKTRDLVSIRFDNPAELKTTINLRLLFSLYDYLKHGNGEFTNKHVEYLFPITQSVDDNAAKKTAANALPIISAPGRLLTLNVKQSGNDVLYMRPIVEEETAELLDVIFMFPQDPAVERIKEKSLSPQKRRDHLDILMAGNWDSKSILYWHFLCKTDGRIFADYDKMIKKGFRQVYDVHHRPSASAPIFDITPILPQTNLKECRLFDEGFSGKAADHSQLICERLYLYIMNLYRHEILSGDFINEYLSYLLDKSRIFEEYSAPEAANAAIEYKVSESDKMLDNRIGELMNYKFIGVNRCGQYAALGLIDIYRLSKISGVDSDKVQSMINALEYDITRKKYFNDRRRKETKKLNEYSFTIKVAGMVLAAERYKKFLDACKDKKDPEYFLSLLNETELKRFKIEKKKIEDIEKKRAANRCGHVAALAVFKESIDLKDREAAILELEKFYVDDYVKSAEADFINCRVCGFDIICPHLDLMTRIYLHNRIRSDIPIKLLKSSDNAEVDDAESGKRIDIFYAMSKYKANIKDSYNSYCRICGELMYKNDMEYPADGKYEAEDPLAVEIKYECARVLRDISFNYLVNMQNLAAICINAVYDIIDEYNSLFYKSRISTEEQINEKRKIYITIYVLTYFAKMVESNPDTKFIDYESILSSVGKGKINMQNYCIIKILKQYGAIINQSIGNPNIVRDEIIKAFSAYDKIGFLVLKKEPEDLKLFVDLMTDSTYKFIYRVYFSTHNYRYDKFSIVEEMNNILGGKSIKELLKAKKSPLMSAASGSLSYSPRLVKEDGDLFLTYLVIIMYYFLSAELPRASNIMMPQNIDDDIDKDAALPKFAEKLLAHPPKALDMSFMSVGNYIDLTAYLINVSEKLYAQKKFARFIPICRYPETKSGRSMYFKRKKYEYTPWSLIYDEKGDLLKFNKFVYKYAALPPSVIDLLKIEKAEYVQLTVDNMKSILAANIADFDNTKWIDVATNKGITRTALAADKELEGRVKEAIVYKRMKENFYNIYSISCPAGFIVHEFDPNDKCKNCGITKDIIENRYSKDAADFYDKWKAAIVEIKEAREEMPHQEETQKKSRPKAADISGLLEINVDLLYLIANQLNVNANSLFNIGICEKHRYSETTAKKIDEQFSGPFNKRLSNCRYYLHTIAVYYSNILSFNVKKERPTEGDDLLMEEYETAISIYKKIEDMNAAFGGNVIDMIDKLPAIDFQIKNDLIAEAVNAAVSGKITLEQQSNAELNVLLKTFEEIIGINENIAANLQKYRKHIAAFFMKFILLEDKVSTITEANYKSVIALAKKTEIADPNLTIREYSYSVNDEVEIESDLFDKSDLDLNLDEEDIDENNDEYDLNVAAEEAEI